jgi:hypothetical protein
MVTLLILITKCVKQPYPDNAASKQKRKDKSCMHAKVDKKETGSGRQGSQDTIGESTAVTIIGC